MKTVLLIGLGRFGRHLAMQLNELGHQVMVSNRRVITQSVIIPDFFFYLIKLLHHRAVPKCFKVI